jgi:S-adenosylmethionine/arginine decarboxylase-like enzyme
MTLQPWGQLTAVTLHECDYNILINPDQLKAFCLALCKEIDMIPYGEATVKRFGKGDLEGYTAVQLIETSTITLHADEFGKRAFIDVFSCKSFDDEKTKMFSQTFFKAGKGEHTTLQRG